jgi:ribosomal protein S8
MIARFPNMIAVMQNTIKTGQISCEVPVNKLCISTLRLLREQSLIYGFQYVSPRQTRHRLYPRIKIFFKYSDVNNPCLYFLRAIKNTRSNFFINKGNYMKYRGNKKIMISTPQGLNLLSFHEASTKNSIIRGKALLLLSY